MIARFAIGGASFGGIGSARRLVGRGETVDEAHAVLDAAYALGIRWIDTASTYGDGASERMIGSWLRARGHRDVQISSKVGVRGGLGHAHVIAEVERSLARLGVETIDLLFAHVPDPTRTWPEVAHSFTTLVAHGKVRRFGASNVELADLESLARAGFTTVQNQLNLLHRDDLHAGVLAACDRLGLAYTAYSPLAGGLLAGHYALSGAIPDDSRIALRRDLYAAAWTADNAARIARVCDEAAAREVSPAGLATWWLVHCPSVAAIMLGARRPAQLERMVDEVLRLPADAALWHRLGAA